MERPKNECQNAVAELLLFYLNSEVTDEQFAEVDAHLPECEICREELEFLRIAKDLEKSRQT